MRNTTIILFITFLLFAVTTENVNAESNSPIQKEQKNDLVEGVFKVTDEIFEFSGNILKIGNKEKGTIEKQVAQDNKNFDVVENLRSFVRDAVKFSWNIITLGYDEQEQDYGNYREYPTLQQWENIEAMSIFIEIAEVFINDVICN